METAFAELTIRAEQTAENFHTARLRLPDRDFRGPSRTTSAGRVIVNVTYTLSSRLARHASRTAVHDRSEEPILVSAICLVGPCPVTKASFGDDASQNSHASICQPKDIVLNGVAVERRFSDHVIQDDPRRDIVDAVHNDGAQRATSGAIESQR